MELPRDKVLKYGVNNLTNEELLSIILRNGTKNNSVYDISKAILEQIKTLNNLQELNINSFNNIKGIGLIKKIELMSCIELGKRIYIENNNKNNIYYDIKYVYEDNKELFINKKQEYFYCLYLDNKNKLIERKLLFIGTINQSIVHPREIFKEAYLLSASKIICLHNHPSGDINPSYEDIDLTKKLIEIGNLLGIKLLDHLIITNNNYYSFYNSSDLFKNK